MEIVVIDMGFGMCANRSWLRRLQKVMRCRRIKSGQTDRQTNQAPASGQIPCHLRFLWLSSHFLFSQMVDKDKWWVCASDVFGTIPLFFPLWKDHCIVLDVAFERMGNHNMYYTMFIEMTPYDDVDSYHQFNTPPSPKIEDDSVRSWHSDEFLGVSTRVLSISRSGTRILNDWFYFFETTRFIGYDACHTTSVCILGSKSRSPRYFFKQRCCRK